jgi:hypothetical protein
MYSTRNESRLEWEGDAVRTNLKFGGHIFDFNDITDLFVYYGIAMALGRHNV